MYSNRIAYKEHEIIVENYLYWVKGFPEQKFLSMDDAKAAIDRMTDNIDAILQRPNTEPQ